MAKVDFHAAAGPRPWTHGITSASYDVECGGEVHQLLWRAGELLIPAHPDPEAERALAGLGGAPCRCVELLDAWTACTEDPRVLVLGPRGSDAVPAWPDSPGRRARLARSTRLDPLTTVLSLGDQLPRRLVATVAHNLAPLVGEPMLFPMLHVAVHGRVRTSLQRWQRGMPEVILELIPGTAEPSLTGSAERLLARLSLGWLTDVWARELDVVSGRFVLSASPVSSPDVPGATEWRLLAVDAAMHVMKDGFTTG